MSTLSYLMAFAVALALSMLIIPVMIRFAPALGMLDEPDERKVHAHPIPRVGGIGIVVGSLIPLYFILGVAEPQHMYFFWGALVLLVFGSWDDSCELGHYVKFIGQFMAVVPLVYLGDVYVTHLPLMGLEPISDTVGRLFTVVALIGMINAMNHSDGLDGLAGGESLLSLGCLIYLAYLGGGDELVLIGLATVGGVFGFLRFNSHPARIFMGDSGSQFLGFVLGYVAIDLTQNVNPALSPAIPALILGLPVADIIAVLAQRAYQKMNWFKATKNHIHHRLLEVGFDHYSSVVVIYAVHAALVLSALVLGYAGDGLILSIYLGVCVVIFGLLGLAARSDWKVGSASGETWVSRLVQSRTGQAVIVGWPTLIVRIGLPLVLVGTSLAVDAVPIDFTMGSSLLLLGMVATIVMPSMRSTINRGAIYIAVGFIVFLCEISPSPFYLEWAFLEKTVYAILAAMVAMGVRYERNRFFTVTPMDFLVVIGVIVVGFLSELEVQQYYIDVVLIKMIILYYGCELIIATRTKAFDVLWFGVVIGLSVITFKGFIVL